MLSLQTAKPFLIIAAVIGIVYGSTLGHGFFAWDDDILVYENPIVQNVSPASIGKAFTSYDPELYVPFTILSFQLEHLIAGNRPFLYHLDNLLLHLANCCLLFLLLKRLGTSEELSLIGALLFAIHPVQAESAAWIAARKDLLAGLFFFLTLLNYLRYREQETTSSYLKTLLLFLGGLLSKASVIGTPIILLAIDWYQGRRIDWNAIREKLPFFALSVLFGLIAIGGKTKNIQDFTFFQTILLAIKEAIFSLRLALFPFGLQSVYEQHELPFIGDPSFFIPIIIAIVLIVIALWSIKRTKIFVFSLLLFYLLLAPTFSNFSRGSAVYFADDRYLYLPLVGLVFGFVTLIRWLLQKMPLRNPAASIVATALLLPLAALSFQRAQLWGDSERFFREGIVADPQSAVMHFNLGVVLQRQQIIDEAMSEYAAAIKLQPNYTDAYANLGVALMQTNRFQEARIMLEKALELRPSHAKAKQALEAAKLFQ
jgi:tetratricopeptide (TPR) repeat protein